jgi:hypothetical protein
MVLDIEYPAQRNFFPSIFEFPPAKPPLFFKSPKNGAEITVTRFLQKKKRKKTIPYKKKRGPDAFIDAYRSVFKNHYIKKKFVTSWNL